LSFGALSLFSLSLTFGHTLSWRNFGIGERREKKARGSKDQAGKCRIEKLQEDSLEVLICMCVFLARFCMHGISCGSFVVVAWVLLGVTLFSS